MIIKTRRVALMSPLLETILGDRSEPAQDAAEVPSSSYGEQVKAGA